MMEMMVGAKGRFELVRRARPHGCNDAGLFRRDPEEVRSAYAKSGIERANLNTAFEPSSI